MKVRKLIKNHRVWLALALMAVGLAVNGCATTSEEDNASSKPWNSPEGWQNGALPSMMQPH